MIPGPTEPSFVAVQQFLLPLLAELETLDKGISITYKDGERSVTKVLRARLFYFSGDTPARSKICGFPSHMAKTNFCPWCHADQENETFAVPGVEGAPPLRCPLTHRRASLWAEHLSTSQQSRQGPDTGAHFSALHYLPYWQSVRDSPVDIMHSVHLGIIKQLWHRILVDAGGLDQNEQSSVRECFSSTMLPRGVACPPSLVGLASGGNPTADEYVTIAKLLPAVLAAPGIWDTAIEEFNADSESIKAIMSSKYHPSVADGACLDNWSLLVYPHLQTQAKRQEVASLLASQADSAASTSCPLPLPNHPDTESMLEINDSGSDTDRGGGISQSNRPSMQKKREKPVSRMVHKGFLFGLACDLSEAVKIMHMPSFREEDLVHLDGLLQGYSRNIGWLRYSSPNNHFIKHITSTLRMYGPARTTWTYASERVNATVSQIIHRISNGKAQQAELSIVKKWCQRGLLDRMLHSQNFLDPRLSKLADPESHFQHKTTDRQVVVEHTNKEVNLGPRCSPLNSKGYRQNKVYELSDLDFDLLLQCLRQHKTSEEHGFLGRIGPRVGPSFGLVDIVKRVQYYASMSFHGYFCSLHGRTNASLGNTYALIKETIHQGSNNRSDTPTKLQPVQILDIFTHKYEVQQPGHPGTTKEFVYIVASCYQTLDCPLPPFQVNEDIPELGYWVVDEKSPKRQVYRAEQLVSNAIVVPWKATNQLVFSMYHYG